MWRPVASLLALGALLTSDGYLTPGGAFQAELPGRSASGARRRANVQMQAAAVAGVGRKGVDSSSKGGRQGVDFIKQLVEAADGKKKKRPQPGGGASLHLMALQPRRPDVASSSSSSSQGGGVSHIGVDNYRHVMAVCEEEGRWERVLLLFRQMLAAHVEPDQDIHDRVARAALAIKRAPLESQPKPVLPYPQPFRSVPSPAAATVTITLTSSFQTDVEQVQQEQLLAKAEREQQAALRTSQRAAVPSETNKQQPKKKTLTRPEAPVELSARLSEALRDVVLRPLETSYTAAIIACVEEAGGGQWETALKMYEEALYRGIDLPHHAKTAVLRACEEGAQLKYAESVFHQISRPSVPDFSAMLSLYRTFHRWRDADHTYAKMAAHIHKEPFYSGDVSEFFGSESSSSTTAMPAMREAGREAQEQEPLEVTLAIMQYMADCPRAGVSPDKLTFLAAIEVCVTEGRWDKVLFLYEKSREMLEDGALEVSWATVQALESMGRSKLADHVYEMAYRRGIVNHWSKWLDRVDLHSYSTLMARVAVRQVFNELLRGPGEALPLHLDRPERGLIIVTGAGKRSEGGAPVLRPAVLKLLRQEFKPQLKAAHVCKDNKGRVIVPWQNIEKWIEGQHQMVQMLRRSRRKAPGKVRALITY